MNESITQTAQNPYAPPESDPLRANIASAPGELASRGSRLAATLIDTLVILAAVVPLMVGYGVYANVLADATMRDAVTYGAQVGGLVVFLVVNVPLWVRRAQSVGKIVMGIRIVDEDGNQASLSTILYKRTLPLWVASWIPVLGSIVGLVDSLAILGKDRLCLHDRIAKTRVVRV